MDVAFVEIVSMGLRWLHVIAAMAWIGSSFYFIHLDLSLHPRDGLPRGAYGEAWQVHGGGFYHMVKFLVAPPGLPEKLTWFKWEAYTTWLSGFSLMVVFYYLNAEMFLIDPMVFDITAQVAVAISLGTLFGAWILYELLCRSPLRDNQFLVAGVIYVALVLFAYELTHVFSGRGAFVHVGALVGTIMVANVFVIVIPNQKKTVAALMEGKEPDPAWGAESKLRSVHNNYLTLPVAFLMIGNHYPLLYATKFNWLIVAIVLALGPVIRHFFNERHLGRPSPWWTWAVAAAGLAAILVLSTFGPRATMATERDISTPTFAQVEEIVIGRCSMCHGSEVVWAGISTAPQGILLDTPERIRRNAHLIDVAAVRSDAMPPGNITGMDPDERRLIAAWLAGADAKK